MRRFHDIFNEIYSNTKIPFNIKMNNTEEIKFLPNKLEATDIIKENIETYNITITTTKEYKNCIPLLKYLIESKVKEIGLSKERIIKNLIEDQYVDLEFIKDNFPWILGKTNIITIHSKSSNREILSLINASYSNYDVISLEYHDYIVIIGDLDDIDEQVKGLRDSIYSNVYIKCYISYCKIDSIKEIGKKINENFQKIDLAIKYNLSEDIYEEKSIIFETIVDSIHGTVKEKMLNNFSQGFSKLNGEMIKTIDVFLKSGLNITEASKELYIHRNTLIYRLDKIQKYTGYDLRSFNDAMIFKIAFLIYIENKK